MADKVKGDELDDENNSYKVPLKKTLDEIQKLDDEDESLRRYKAALLGNFQQGDGVPFPNNPKSVVLKSFSICVEGQPDRTISMLDEGVSGKLDSNPITIPEGANYHVKVEYYVQRDIVTGLKYDQCTYRGPLRVDHSTMMLGSYGPQSEPRVWVSETCEAPKGAMQRGTYSIKSRFLDIDKTEFVAWKWSISVVKSSHSTD